MKHTYELIITEKGQTRSEYPTSERKARKLFNDLSKTKVHSIELLIDGVNVWGYLSFRY